MNKRNAVTLIIVLAIVGGITVFNKYQDPDKQYRERMEALQELEKQEGPPIKQFTDGIQDQFNQLREEHEKELAFLSERENELDVVKTDSGLLYKVIQKGTGKTPGLTSTVRVHYKGTFTDGIIFDQTHNEPTDLAVNRVIAGWTEALQLMQEGAKWELYIPHDLGYGPGGRPPTIPGLSTLVFELELVKVVDEGA